MQLSNIYPQSQSLIKQEDPPERQVCCIMFTDVVGYTLLVEEDEETALEILAQNRELHRFLIEMYGGELIKEMGDGILVSFSSARAAVNCAQELQRSTKSIDQLQLRIGIHMGEVIFCNQDVYGIVVNIASRIQHLAHRGQILVSESVVKRLGIKPGTKSRCIGWKKFKNVNCKVKTYMVQNAKTGTIMHRNLKLSKFTSKAGQLFEIVLSIIRLTLLRGYKLISS